MSKPHIRLHVNPQGYMDLNGNPSPTWRAVVTRGRCGETLYWSNHFLRPQHLIADCVQAQHAGLLT